MATRQAWTPMTGCKGFKPFEGWQTAGLDAHKKPLMCGLGVPVGCRMKHGKRQAWTPMTGCKGFKPFDGF